MLKKLFKQVAQICQRLGMIGLGLVAIDGTRVKAAASDYGARITHESETSFGEETNYCSCHQENPSQN